MSRRAICRVVFFLYVLLFLAALALAIIGTQGYFGVQPDGLAAVWLIFVGLPWSLVATPLALLGAPVILGQVIILAAPLINMWLLWRMCRT